MTQCRNGRASSVEESINNTRFAALSWLSVSGKWQWTPNWLTTGNAAYSAKAMSNRGLAENFTFRHLICKAPAEYRAFRNGNKLASALAVVLVL